MTVKLPSEAAPPGTTDVLRLGVVSFLNTLPLIDGLEDLADIRLRCSVPSGLIDQLLAGETDLALCSTIDFQRSPTPLRVVPAGLLGCDGETLTVRLYSSQPVHRLERIWCDTDSHTSVALLKIVLREMYNIDPELIAYDAREHVADNRPIEWPPAMLLIGDKVVTDSPPAVRYPHQLDLGAAWANLTGLPFVFATWMARADHDTESLRVVAAVLDRQRRRNMNRLDSIIHNHARARGWPLDLAADYLGSYLSYEWTPERRSGLDMFFTKAHEHGLIDSCRPLDVLDEQSSH